MSIGAPIRTQGPDESAPRCWSAPGRATIAGACRPLDVPEALPPEPLRRRRPPGLPEVAEIDVVRHFTRLSQMNYGVDTGIYPLGSCTMKHNPKVAETVAALPGFLRAAPAAARRHGAGEPRAALAAGASALRDHRHGAARPCSRRRARAVR